MPLLFAAVRRMWSVPAGLAAAVGLAVLPVEVITSRSDTMDGVMMVLIVLALWLIVRACGSGRYAWLLGGAAALGVAFDVKLLESLVAVPGLALLAYLGLPGGRKRRLLQLLAAGAVYVAVALAWLAATLLVPPHERPYAIGSTNGSAWNAAFVFNGTDRLAGKSTEPQQIVYQPGHRYPVATQSRARPHPDRAPLPHPTAGASRTAFRRAARAGAARRAAAGRTRADRNAAHRPANRAGGRRRRSRNVAPDGDAAQERRMRVAVAAGLSLWTLTGIVLFSDMARLHPRYVESFVPAVAALLGIGVAWACTVDRRSTYSRARLVALVVALVASVYYVERLLYGRTGVWWVTLIGALGAITLAGFARVGRRADGRRSGWLSAAMIALTLVAVGALPLSADIVSIKTGVTDAGYVGALPREEQRLVSSYLRSHQGGARYELAAESATQIGSLVVQEARPVLILTTYDARVFTTVPELQRAIARGRSEVCVPELVLRQTHLTDQRRLLATGTMDPGARHRRLT